MSPIIGIWRCRLLLLVLQFLVFTDEVNAFSISRLQMRSNDDSTQSLTFSRFERFEDQTFYLLLANSDRFQNWTENQTHVDLIVGRAIDAEPETSRVYGLARIEKWDGIEASIALGLQLELNNIGVMSETLKRMGMQSFIQFYGRSNSRDLPGAEILHYYQFNVRHFNLGVRGNNLLYLSGNETVFNTWLDVIYPLMKEIDIYTRLNYFNRDLELLGQKGTVLSLGIRYNF